MHLEGFSMKWLCAIVVFTGFKLSSACAQNLDDTALARCPGYEKEHPLVSELTWSVSCLLQAIHDRDKGIIAELSEQARCSVMACESEGVLDEDVSVYIFGIGETGKARYPLQSPNDAIRTVLMKSNAALIVVAPSLKGAHVTVIPRTGRESVRADEGHNRDYFECDFDYDPERSIWIVSGGFCLYGTGEEESSDAVVDLTGNDAGSIPVMLWKPKT